VRSLAESDSDQNISQIASIRANWIAAVKAGDVDRLMAMATDDIVIVLASGRCICGKDEVRKNLMNHLGLFDIDLRDSSNEIIVRDKWAIQFSDVARTVTAVRGGVQVEADSKIIALYSRQPDVSWKVARVIQIGR
jgi:ketosteroid isomerase-like protein